jgi:anti-sigma factor RsiW
MNITRDVIKDLLTIYLAGEANADTRALVEEWLRTDPDLARQVEQARSSPLPQVAVPPPTVEKQALDRTRRWWRRRSIVLGAAIYFSALPLSVTFNSSGYQGLLIEGWPERVVVMAIAAALWAIYFGQSRRWHTTAR